jgi:Tfp pilus assembly protein PilN
MYHFLPLVEKRILRREYRVRFAIACLVVLSFVTMLGGVFILPAWILADIKEQTVDKRLSILHDVVTKKQNLELNVVLDNTKKEMKLLRSEEDFLSFRTVLGAVIENKTSGVSLQQFSFSRISAEGDVAISVRGVYRDRDSLVNFRKNLEREKFFTRVDLPIANLAKGRDAEFSIELTAVMPKP